jgi:hypothetical protein
LDRLDQRDILGGGWRRLHMRNQVRTLIVTALGDMQLVAGPIGLALVAEACVCIIGRDNQERVGRQLLVCAPAQSCVLEGVLLHPNAPQRLDRLYLSQVWRHLRSAERLHQSYAILADGQGQRAAFGQVARQAEIIEAGLIALDPGWVEDLAQPDWSDRRQHVQCLAHRLADTLQPIERANGGQHVGRIGTLFAARDQQATRFEHGEQGVEELLLAGIVQDAVAEVVQQGEIKARIGQLQAEQVLPIDAAPHSIGGLAVGQALHVLHDQHERLSPGSDLDGCPLLGKPGRKLSIGKDCTQLITNGQVDVPIGKNRFGSSSSGIRNGRDRLNMQSHRKPPPDSRTIQCSDQFHDATTTANRSLETGLTNRVL